MSKSKLKRLNVQNGRAMMEGVDLSDSELLPCPFCGSPAEHYKNLSFDNIILGFGASCVICSCRLDPVYVSETGAALAWNTRDNEAEE